MASENRGENPDIRTLLLEQGNSFSFVQAMRLLRLVVSSESGPEELADSTFFSRVRIRPELSLNFPESDISSIESVAPPGEPDGKEDEKYLVTATFLGLYGSSSPLPTFYTEDLLEEASNDRSITRDFLDVINAPFYENYFRIWAKYHLLYKIFESFDPVTLERLYCLAGFGEERLRQSIPDAHNLLRYIGLFCQFPRSAEGLRSLLVDRLDETSVQIRQNLPCTATIPEDQRLYLGKGGNRLGDDSWLGWQITDHMGKFAVCAGPLDPGSFHRLLPGSAGFKTLCSSVHLYLNQPYEWEVDLSIDSADIEPACLGGERWSRLGWNCWIYSEKFHEGSLSVRLAVSPEVRYARC